MAKREKDDLVIVSLTRKGGAHLVMYDLKHKKGYWGTALFRARIFKSIDDAEQALSNLKHNQPRIMLRGDVKGLFPCRVRKNNSQHSVTPSLPASS